ncbi:hypothetical protein EDB89DRAFT_570990 [Lactarius sanguifluus]|nr:hypothetical protein EDB89DRAFT_570990 [Lactarius sanguifluus]
MSYSQSSPQVKAVIHYLDQLKVLNLPEIEKLLADDFIQDTRPMSVKVPLKSKGEYMAFLERLAEKLGGRPIEIDIDGIADASVVSKKVFAHILMHGEPLSKTASSGFSPPLWTAMAIHGINEPVILLTIQRILWWKFMKPMFSLRPVCNSVVHPGIFFVLKKSS